MTAVSEPAKPSRRSIVALDAFSFLLADLQTGIGPDLVMFLASVRHFNPAVLGIATAAGGFATVLMQTPAGAITDATTRKRLVVALAALIRAVGATVLVNATAFWLVGVQIIVGAGFAFLPCAVGALSLGLVGRDARPKHEGTNQAFNSSGNIAYASDDTAADGEEKLRLLFADPRVVTFTLVVLLFRLANASMLVLFGQLLPKGSAAGRATPARAAA